jgi:hypothetical protein
MTQAEALFHEIAKNLPNAVEGNLFGAKCLKSQNGRAIAIFWKDSMLFKLDEKVQQDALKLEGSKIGNHLYAPKRPMRGWVSLPYKQSHTWEGFAKLAAEYVNPV